MKIIKNKHVRQFVKYGIVGVMNTMIDFSVYYFFTRYAGFHFLAANFCSWVTAVMVSFLANKFWTFRSYDTAVLARQSARFIIVAIISLVVSQSLLYTFVRIVGIRDLIAKVLTIGIVVFWNFFMNKFWTFRQTHQD